MDPTSSPNTVDRKNLSSLTDKIHTLSALGGRLEDDWLEIDDLLSNLSRIPVGDAALAQASLSKLNELKSVMKTLNKLSTFIATATATLQRLSEPTILHLGLSSLPLEILSLIRVWLHALEDHTVYASPSIDSTYSLQQVVPNRSFPLVCRRFRELELSIPELWSTVTTDMTFEQVKLRIARSGDLPLRVQINSDPDKWLAGGREKSCQCDLWNLIASHAQRCESMDIHIQEHLDGEPFWHHYVLNCFNAFDDIHFRKLRRLAIVVDLEEDMGTLSTLGTWSMPQLSELSCSGTAALFALPLSHPLDVLKIYIQVDELDVNDLIDLLSSPTGSNLQTLDLILREVDCSDTQSTSRAVLPSLKLFSLHLLSGTSIHSLLECIQAPSIERITVEIYQEGYHLIDKIIEWISSQRNPNLRIIDVQLLGTVWEREDRDIVYAGIVDAVSLDNDSGDTPSNLPTVCVETPHIV